MAVSGLADGDGGMQHMLIDSLRFALERSECLDGFWSNLDAGDDGTLGIANSARPFMVAARFSHKPQSTLAVVAGEDAAVSFARSLSAYLGEDKVLRFPERADLPFDKKHADLATVARRMEAAHALQTGRQVVVVTSARALLRTLPPANANASTPLSFVCGQELADMPGAQAAGIQDFDGLIHALESRGFSNTGELDGPGTFCTRGGTVDVYPGNLSFPVRLDFFGDELDAMGFFDPVTQRRTAQRETCELLPAGEVLSLDGAPISGPPDLALPQVYPQVATAADYLPPNALVALCDTPRVADRAKNYLWQLGEDITALLEQGVLTGKHPVFAETWEGLCAALAKRTLLYFDSFTTGSPGVSAVADRPPAPRLRHQLRGRDRRFTSLSKV